MSIEEFSTNRLARKTSLSAQITHLKQTKQTNDALRQMKEWNATTVEYPCDRLVHQLFEAQVERTPAALALVSSSQRLSYQQLNQQANRLAHHLRSLGVGPDHLVGVCLDRSVELVMAQLAILKAGGAYVPLDPASPPERLLFQLQDSQVTILLTSQALANDLASSYPGQLLCLETAREWLAPFPAYNLDPLTRLQHSAYVIYTSGSTGLPKGVVIEHQSLLNLIFWHQRTYQVRPAERISWMAGVAFDASVWELWPALTAGACLYLPEEQIRLDPQRLRDWLIEQQISLAFAPTPLAERLLALAWPARTALRILFAGGDTLHQYAPVGLPFQLVNLYGPTESTVITTAALVEEATEKAPALAPPIGRPIANTQIYLLDEQLQPVAPGKVGELYIAGEGLARGYLQRPELTAERFITHPGLRAGARLRLYKTGDLARFLPDGSLAFLGRNDGQVKIRGYRIEIGEIETQLRQHPLVQEAAVIVRDDAVMEKQLLAYVVLVPHTPGPEREVSALLRRDLQSKLPVYMLPASFVFLEQLPLTVNGKVDRQALPDPAILLSQSEDNFVEPRDVLELQLVRMWEEVLDIRSVSITDNFFELGGDSMRAIHLIARIEQSFNRKLPMALFFQANTIERLADILRQPGEGETFSPLVSIQPDGSRPPLFCIHSWGGTVMNYVDLARYLGPDQPVYGIQSVGLYGEAECYSRFEDMAAHYIQVMRALQPEGPYHLSGYSLGGFIAFEMARQLHASGQQVATLALIDPTNAYYGETELLDDVAYWLWWLSWMEFEDNGTFSSAHLSQLSTEQQLDYILEQFNLLEAHGLSHTIPSRFKLPNGRHLLKVQKNNTQALIRYQPQIYPDRLLLFRASEPPVNAQGELGRGMDQMAPRLLEMTKDPHSGWGGLAGKGIEVIPIPGSHFTIMHDANVEVLARLLRGQLDKANSTTIEHVD